MYKLHSYTNSVDKYYHLYLEKADDNLKKTISQIKSIPKEIVIKNILSLP